MSLLCARARCDRQSTKGSSGGEDWSFGFETPITSFTFIDLKPDTEYEVQVRSRNATGEGPPAFFNIRTDPAGAAGNAIPFPLQ